VEQGLGMGNVPSFTRGTALFCVHGSEERVDQLRVFKTRTG